MWNYVKKYLEKYTMGMIITTVLLFSEEVGLPLKLPVWKQLILSLIFLPAMWYIFTRTNDRYSTDVDENFFTWKKFGLFLSMVLGIVSTFVAATLLGYIQYVK